MYFIKYGDYFLSTKTVFICDTNQGSYIIKKVREIVLTSEKDNRYLHDDLEQVETINKYVKGDIYKLEEVKVNG